MLKSFFRKLPDPLFTDEYYTDFIKTSLIKDEAQKMKAIRSLLVGLPQHHYRLGYDLGHFMPYDKGLTLTFDQDAYANSRNRFLRQFSTSNPNSVLNFASNGMC